MAEHKLSKKKRIAITVVSISLAIAVLCGAVTYIGLDMSHKINYAARYTEAQHLERVSARVEKYFMTEDSGYTGYMVYPLYDENDKLSYFLVEFEPVGFVYIKLNEYHSEIIRMYSMYTYDNAFEYYRNNSWRRYRYFQFAAIKNEYGTWEEPIPYPEQGWKFDANYVASADDVYKRWEVSQDGEFLEYFASHFREADVLNEKKYLLAYNGSLIPSVRQGEYWFNLVSMEQFKFNDYNGYCFIEELQEYFLPTCDSIFLFKLSKNL